LLFRDDFRYGSGPNTMSYICLATNGIPIPHRILWMLVESTIYVLAVEAENLFQGRPEPPHTSWKNLSLSKSSLSTLGCHASLIPRYLAMIEAVRGRESVQVVNFNHVYFRVPGLWVFFSTFIFLSDRDVFVSTASIYPRLAPALLLPLSAGWFWEDVSGEAIVSAAVATVQWHGQSWQS